MVQVVYVAKSIGYCHWKLESSIIQLFIVNSIAHSTYHGQDTRLNCTGSWLNKIRIVDKPSRFILVNVSWGLIVRHYMVTRNVLILTYTLLWTMFMKCQLNMMVWRLSYWDEHQLWISGENLALGWSPDEHKNNGPILIQIDPPGGILTKISQKLKIR